MRPPWAAHPDLFQDTFWIVAKSDYLEQWRAWFCALSEEEQSQYQRDNVPPDVCEPFYSIFGVPRYDPTAILERYRDEDGLLMPPWAAIPAIPLGSIGWRMGGGEDYWHGFFDWLHGLSVKEQAAFRAKYPEPETVTEGLPWTGIYDRAAASHAQKTQSRLEREKAQTEFDERRHEDFLRDRFPEFWARFGGMPDVSGKRILDFGCGRGGMVQRLMEAGASSALGIELNQSYIDFANRKVAGEWPRAEFLCADIRDISSEPADIIVSTNVMEHVMSLPDTLAAVVNACKPGGELYIGFSPLWHSPYGHHHLIGARLPWAHLPRKNRAFLDRMQDEAGRTPGSIQELGFNGATPADFRAALKSLPVDVISARRNVAASPMKNIAMKAMLLPTFLPAIGPRIEKFVTVGLYWHLRRHK